MSRAIDVARLVWALPRQRRIPFWSRHQVVRERDRRLRMFLGRAYDTVPYYRRLFDQAGTHPSAFHTLEDLARLPIVTGDALRAAPLDFVSSRVDPERCVLLKSGGSTGREKRVYYDPDSLLQNVLAGERLELIYRSFLPRGRRYRRAQIHAPHSTYNKIQGAQHSVLAPLRALGPRNLRLSVGMPFMDKVAALNAFRPDMIRGYGRAVGELFDRARREGVALHPPALAVMGGEALLPEMRAAMTEHFGVPVFMNYSSNEALRLGFECGVGPGYHLHEDLCAVRIVGDDGGALAHGEQGRIIISNLMNRGTMLLNYDQGDRGRLNTEPCACGRGSARIELTETRDVPMLKTLDGRVIHSAELLLSLGDHAEIDLAQIVVEEPARWRILLISADPGATRRWIGRAEELAHETAGPTVEVAVELTDTPAQTRAGKTLPVIVRCWGAPPYHD